MSEGRHYSAGAVDNSFSFGKSTALYGGYVDGWVIESWDIPQGSTINSATIETSNSTSTSYTATTVNGTISGIDIDDCPDKDTMHTNWATVTSASVAWSSVASWNAYTSHSSPDIKSVIEEIIGRAGWHRTHSLAIVCKDNSSSANAYRQGANTHLHISHTAPAAKNISGVISRYGTGMSGVSIGGTTTAADGSYSVSVAHDYDVVLTPTKSGETFTPSSRSYTNVTSNVTNQNFSAAGISALPLVSIAYSTKSPIYKFANNVPIINILYTPHAPSRNVYNMDTAGIAYYPHNPTIGSGTIDIRDRFKTNYIGERISLKFQNDGDIDLVLNDFATVVSTLYRKHGIMVNIIGDQVSLKFQNDSDVSMGLEYLKLIMGDLYRKSGTRLNVKGTHLGFKFQNTSDLPFQLQYLKIFGEAYENQ
jgi:hypothetical protein